MTRDELLKLLNSLERHPLKKFANIIYNSVLKDITKVVEKEWE